MGRTRKVDYLGPEMTSPLTSWRPRNAGSEAVVQSSGGPPKGLNMQWLYQLTAVAEGLMAKMYRLNQILDYPDSVGNVFSEAFWKAGLFPNHPKICILLSKKFLEHHSKLQLERVDKVELDALNDSAEAHFRSLEPWVQPHQNSLILHAFMDLFCAFVRVNLFVEKVLSILEAKGLRSPILMKCKCLKLDTPIFKSVSPGIANLLESSPNLETLVITTMSSSSYYKVLSIMEAKGLRSPLLKCECLRLDTHIFKSVLPGIANLLESSPNLETFRVTAMSSSCYCKYYGDKLAELCKFKKHHYLRSQKRTFKCLTLHLKKVEFTAGLTWLCCCDHKFSFVRFLLKNARVLQSMVIHMPSEDGRTPLELYQAAQKLLSFPSSSPDAVVVFS